MASDWTAWADGTDLAGMSRSTNPLQRAGYDPDEVRANPEMRRLVMQQAASPYGIAAVTGADGSGAANSLIGGVAQRYGRPGSYSPQPAMPTPRQPGGASPRPATSATTTASMPAATGPASNANSTRAYPMLPATDKAPTPIRPMPAAPGGAVNNVGAQGGVGTQGTPLDELGRQALEKGLAAGGMALSNAQALANADPGTEKLEAKIAKEEIPTPYKDASGKPLPKFAPSTLRKVGRGLESTAIGLLAGGLPGMAVGALHPELMPGGAGYNDPNSAYQAQEDARTKQLAADQEQMRNVSTRFRATTDARKGAGDSLKAGVTAFGDASRDAAAMMKKPGTGKSGGPKSMMVNGQPALVTWDAEKGWMNAEPGSQFGQPVQGNVTPAPPLTREGNSAFQEWMKDPQDYEKFQRAMAAAKASTPGKNTGFMNAFAAYRLLDYATRYNPSLLPTIGPQLAKMLGDPSMGSSFSQVPLDQPLSPETGQPIGTAMPGALTASNRTAAQNAEKFLKEYPRISKEVEASTTDLGPVKGRMVMGYLLGTVGSTGNPQADERLSKLRTDLKFVGSNAAKFHINSVKEAENFDNLVAVGKSPAAAIQGMLDAVKGWASTAQNQGRGYGEGKQSALPGAPAGAGGAQQPSANNGGGGGGFDWDSEFHPVGGVKK